MSIRCSNQCYGFFLSFKQRTVKLYPEIFETGDRGESVGGADKNFGEKWGWYQSVAFLSNYNIERFKHITKLKATECFMMLAFSKEKNELEMKQIKKANKI